MDIGNRYLGRCIHDWFWHRCRNWCFEEFCRTLTAEVCSREVHRSAGCANPWPRPAAAATKAVIYTKQPPTRCAGRLFVRCRMRLRFAHGCIWTAHIVCQVPLVLFRFIHRGNGFIRNTEEGLCPIGIVFLVVVIPVVQLIIRPVSLGREFAKLM